MAACLTYAVDRHKPAHMAVIAALIAGLLINMVSGIGGPALILAALLVCAVITDVNERLIPNALIFPAVLLGLLINAISRPGGLVLSLIGLGTGFGAMLILYMAGSITGGDVKLAAAVGALTGPWFTVGALAWAVLTSSVAGIIIMAATGRFKELLRFTVLYFKHLIFKTIRRDFSREPLAKADVALPFAVFIAAGGMIELLFPGVMFHWLTVFSNALAAMSAAL